MPAPRALDGSRMAWLDGLRAVAVLLVVYAHLSHYEFVATRVVSAEWLNAGTAGVMLFFLVSGYIIPASLDRHGDPRRFWISRLFRLMPLYLVICAVVIVAGLAPDQFDGRAAFAHLTMLPMFLAVAVATPVLWTLTYEMTFYLLVTSLFVLRLRRFDGPVAIILAVLGVAFAPLLSHGWHAAVPAATVLAAGLLAVSSRRRWLVVPGGLLLGGLAVVLLANQDQSHQWDGLLILAVMFTGTLINRADHGTASWWQVALTGSVVSAALLTNWFAELRSLNALTPHYITRSVITLLVIAGGFAAGMLTRRWRTPGWLAWIGLVSYSVYLVHYVLIQLTAPLLVRLGDHVAYGVAFLALLAGICWLTHRFVEVPAQRLGRRVAAWSVQHHRDEDAVEGEQSDDQGEVEGAAVGVLHTGPTTPAR